VRPWLLALLALPVLAPVAVNAAPSSPDASTHLALFPTVSAFHDRAQREQARELEQQLVALPDVVRARVALSRVHPAHVPLDQPLPVPTLRVFLSTRGSGPSDEAVRSVLRGAQLSGVALDLIRESTAAPETESAPVARDTPGSVLKHALAVSLVANVLLATLLLARRKLRLS
jgi:hypothetical protein